MKTILYRPTGLEELLLVYESKMRAWPPRLPEQPIFYPVLNFGYAEQIARDWNTRSRSFAGYVTRFEIEGEYAANFERRVVGGREHEELWVPAEQLDEFNQHILGRIERVGAYFGSRFVGFVPRQGRLAGLDAAAQLSRLADLAPDDGAALREEVGENHRVVFLNYPFWETECVLSECAAERVLSKVRAVWSEAFPERSLRIT
ncbi:MAG: hypothetical protein ACR2HO_10750 [Rubrobacteraceae bacterium]